MFSRNYRKAITMRIDKSHQAGYLQRMHRAGNETLPAAREEQSVEERRKYPRKPVYFRVDFMDAKGQVSMGLAKNLSLGGMFVEQASGLSLGETITAAFALPDGQPFKTKAEVVRVDATGFGLKFVDLFDRYPPDYLQGLKTYCAA
jgi:hypothetical protein